VEEKKGSEWHLSLLQSACLCELPSYKEIKDKLFLSGERGGGSSSRRKLLGQKGVFAKDRSVGQTSPNILNRQKEPTVLIWGAGWAGKRLQESFPEKKGRTNPEKEPDQPRRYKTPDKKGKEKA